MEILLSGFTMLQAQKFLKKTTITGNNAHKWYISGVEYEDNALAAIYHEEGRITPNGSDYQYEYNLTDHLGNVRASFSDVNEDGAIQQATELLQEQTYYPFGLQMSGLQTVQVGNENLYQFQGQELQKELGWSQFKWRNADPTIGRFFNIDLISEDYYYNSTYAFSENKVVSHRELEGLETEIAITLIDTK